jgi:hypothetical protein
MSEELLIFFVAVAVFAVAGIAVGMLVAPRLGRLAEPKDDDAGDRTD